MRHPSSSAEEEKSQPHSSDMEQNGGRGGGRKRPEPAKSIGSVRGPSFLPPQWSLSSPSPFWRPHSTRLPPSHANAAGSTSAQCKRNQLRPPLPPPWRKGRQEGKKGEVPFHSFWPLSTLPLASCCCLSLSLSFVPCGSILLLPLFLSCQSGGHRGPQPRPQGLLHPDHRRPAGDHDHRVGEDNLRLWGRRRRGGVGEGLVLGRRAADR